MSVDSSDEESPLPATNPQMKPEIHQPSAEEAARKRRESLDRKPIAMPHTLELSSALSNDDLL